MADRQEEMRKMREKRLAMLNKNAATPPPAQSAQPSSESTSSASVEGPKTPSAAVASRLVEQTKVTDTPPKRIPSSAAVSSSVPSANPSPAKPAASTSSSNASPAARAKPTVKLDDFATWQDAALRRVLGVTLDIEVAEASGWQLVYLKELKEELDGEDAQPVKSRRLDTDLLERLLLARLLLDPRSMMTDDPELVTVLTHMSDTQTTFEYLSSSWKRALDEEARVGKTGAEGAARAERLEVLKQAKDMLVLYIGNTLAEPEMFPQPSNRPLGHSEFLPILLNPDTDAQHLPSYLVPNLIHALCNAFADELETHVTPIFAFLAHDMLFKKVSLKDPNWRSYYGAFLQLVDVKPLAVALTQYQGSGGPSSFKYPWSPEGMAGHEIELRTILGPFLRLSVFRDAFPDISETYFLNLSNDRSMIQAAMNAVRPTLTMLQTMLGHIINRLIRASPAAREQVLDYVAQAIKLNEKRGQIQVDRRIVAKDGFMLNLQSVLITLSEPFIDPGYTKLDKVDPLYFKRSKRIDVDEITKINATQEESTKFMEDNASALEPANFISEIFFLTNACLHYGIRRAITNRKDTKRQLEHVEKEIKRMEEDTSWHGTPSEARIRAQIQAAKADLDRRQAGLHASEAQLFDPDFLGRMMAFANFSMAWLVRLAEPRHQHPRVPVELPLPVDSPIEFRMLPEYLIEDIPELLKFVSKQAPQLFMSTPKNDLLTFLVVFLSAGRSYVKNPYLKGVLVEVLAANTWPFPGYPQGLLGDVINTMDLSLKHFVSSLITIYIEIETTGSHTQFFDKFNIRFYVTQVLKAVWQNHAHRQAFRRESLDIDKFTRFINLLNNDTTFLLDESLSRLADIHNTQVEMDDAEAWAARPQAERDERAQRFGDWESSAKSYLGLVNETLWMLKTFTEETKDPFVRPEIVNRFAPMLDYNLQVLAGPKLQELKVKDPKAYKFEPRQLLSDLLQIFINLSSKTEFCAAIAQDGRSYSKELFVRAINIARNRALKTGQELEALEKMIVEVEKIKAEDEAEEAEMGDAPEEFLDPLTYIMMRDPVKLPTSKTVVDYSTIQQHLLSDPTDPFNRSPLKVEDCVRDDELRERITTYMAEIKRKRREAAAKAVSEAVQEDIKMSDG